ncbi:MAG: MFS transporter [Candidatus Omnitrophota bacterium]
MLRALFSRNYRLFFCGQGISLIGTWMQNIAVSWLVYRLTQSAFLLGLVGFSMQIPTFIFTPFAGVFVDRHNRHRLIIITQILAMVQAFILAILVLTNKIQIWQIISLSVFLGLVNSFDIPTRHAFIFDIVEKKEDISNAIALNSSIFNSARLIGPLIAGVLIPLIGEGMCFLVNGFSFIAVIIALIMMKIKERKIEVKKTHIFEELKEGFSYAFNFVPIRLILALLALISLMGISYAVLMPIFATKILHGTSRTYGFLMSAAGTGALFGAFYLASRRNIIGLGKIVAISTLVFGAGLIIFSQSEILWLSLLILAFIGFGLMVQSAASNIILQTIVEDDKRGRIMSLFACAFMGMIPFGSLLAGVLASRIGAPNTLIIGGITCFLGGLFFLTKISFLEKIIHPVYTKKGIIPEVVRGIQEVEMK